MLLQNPNDLQTNNIFKGLIYGVPGIGKSTIALSAPKPVCIDLDRGMHRVEPQFRVPSLQVEDYQQILDLLNSNELDNFDTIVIDTLGKLVDRIGDWLAKSNPKTKQGDGQLSMKGWGAVKLQFLTLFKILQSKNKSIIFVAHEREERIGDNIMKRPDVAGSSGKEILKELDFMGYMEMKGNKRTICFMPSEEYYAKNSLGLNNYIEIKDTKTGNNFIQENIFKLSEKRLEEQAKLRQEYDGLIKHVEKKTNGLKDLQDVNTYLQELQAIEHIWDSKYKAWDILKNKAESLGFKYNKDKKEFE